MSLTDALSSMSTTDQHQVVKPEGLDTRRVALH